MNVETLDTLPGEGVSTTTRVALTRTCVRAGCDICGEPAHFRFTYLFGPNPRTNPASSAYHRDDCSFCEDAHAFGCREHQNAYRQLAPENMEWCSTFPATERWKHLFLSMVETEDPLP